MMKRMFLIRACRILGIASSKDDMPLDYITGQLDKEALAKLAHDAYRRLMKLHHTDVGGDVDTCLLLNEAYARVKLLCSERVWQVPRGRDKKGKVFWKQATPLQRKEHGLKVKRGRLRARLARLSKAA